MSDGIIRHTRHHPCGVCAGYDEQPRGRGLRCHGFTTETFIFCTREEHAGQAPPAEGANAWRHRRTGDCACGQEHGTPAAAPPRPERHRARPPRADHQHTRRRPDVVYDYAEHQVCRSGHGKRKEIWQRRPCPDHPGAYLGNLDGVTLALYRRGELLATNLDTPVFINEGEKAVEACRARGLLATCSPMGARKWRDDYSTDLAGRHCVIVEDNDPDGRAHAEQVARSLHGTAASVRILHLPDLPERGDIVDFFDAGGTNERLLMRALTTPEWRAPEDATDSVLEHGAPYSQLQHDLDLAQQRLQRLRAEAADLRRENAQLIQERTLIFAVLRNKHIKAQRLPLLATINQVFEKRSHPGAEEYIPLLLEYRRQDGTAEGIAPNAGIGAKAAGKAIKAAAEWGFWERPTPKAEVVLDPQTGISHYRTVVKIKPNGSKLELLRKLASLDPQQPTTWGGRRTKKACPAHPDADVVRTAIDRCAECGRELDCREQVIPAEPLAGQDDRLRSDLRREQDPDEDLAGQDDRPPDLLPESRRCPDCGGPLLWYGPGRWACRACGSMAGYAVREELAALALVGGSSGP